MEAWRTAAWRTEAWRKRGLRGSGSLSLRALVLVDAVLDEPDHQRRDGAGCEPGQRLDHEYIGGPRFVQRAGAGDHRHRQGLQEGAAQESAAEAGEGVAA